MACFNEDADWSRHRAFFDSSVSNDAEEHLHSQWIAAMQVLFAEICEMVRYSDILRHLTCKSCPPLRTNETGTVTQIDNDEENEASRLAGEDAPNPVDDAESKADETSAGK